jgi:hypothetical protein
MSGNNVSKVVRYGYNPLNGLLEQQEDGNLVSYVAYYERERCRQHLSDRLKETLIRERSLQARIKELEKHCQYLAESNAILIDELDQQRKDGGWYK